MAYQRKIKNSSNVTIGVYMTNGKYIEVPPKGEVLLTNEKMKSKNPYTQIFEVKLKETVTLPVISNVGI